MQDDIENESVQQDSSMDQEQENENEDPVQEPPDLLEDLEDDKFIEEQKTDEKKNDIIKGRLERIKLEKQQLQLENLKIKLKNKIKKIEDDQIFDDKATPIVGKDRRQMIAK